MIPLALVYMVIMAAALLVLSLLGISPDAVWLGFLPAYWAMLGALNIVLAVLVFVFLDRGRIVSPASSRIDAEELARLRALSVPRRLAGAQGD
jgi:NADH-quinone oxidoreductase subunit H